MKHKQTILGVLAAVLLVAVVAILVRRSTAAPVPAPAPTGLTAPIALVDIPAGEFLMGSPEDEEGRYHDEQQHLVKISRPFLIGKTEITQRQWFEVMGTTLEQQWSLANKSRVKKGIIGSIDANCPMVWINRTEAFTFCWTLSGQEHAAGRLPEGSAYRLPTEAEWEYACRAGLTDRFPGGDDKQFLDETGWYAENSGAEPYSDAKVFEDVAKNLADATDESFNIETTRLELKLHQVAQKRPNAWGVYDMHGNATEWCLDWYGDYPASDTVDSNSFFRGTGFNFVGRGGCWRTPSSLCRAASRYCVDRNRRNSNLGFRVVLAPYPPASTRNSGESQVTE